MGIVEDQNPEVLEAANEVLDALDALGDIARNEDWTRLADEDGQEEGKDTQVLLNACRWLAEGVKGARGMIVASEPHHRNAVAETLAAIARHVRGIANFNQTEPASRDRFGEPSRDVRSQTLELLSMIGVWLSIHALRQAERPTGRLNENLKQAQSLVESIRKHEQDASAAADAARTESSQAGAAVFAKAFEKNAADHFRRSKQWLQAGAAFVVLAGALAIPIVWPSLWPGSTPENGWRWLQPLTAKIFLLSLSTYCATWCGRISLANYHNASVNRHRAASVRALKAFRASGTSDSTKDAIVLEAARAVFENVQTGYLHKQPGDQTTMARPLEIVRPLGKE